jgi:alkylation response protein AidB-like acyl-CoA dehydrogenase
LFVPDAHLSDALVVDVRTRDGNTMEDGISLLLVPKAIAGKRALLGGFRPLVNRGQLHRYRALEDELTLAVQER